MNRFLAFAALTIVLAADSPALAQAAGTQAFPRIEASAGGGLFGGASMGGQDAALRTNSAQAQPYRLFSTETEFAAAPMFEARAGYALTRRYMVEGRFAYGRPELRTSVSGDVEGAPAITLVEEVHQYVLDAGLLVRLDELRLAGLVPFAAVGAGYLRQLHEERTLVEEGQVFYAGGGVRHPLFARDRGRLKAGGLRIDARVYFLREGVAFDDGVRPQGAISGSFFVAF